MNISLFLKEVLSLLAIVEPLGAIPIFLSLTSGMSERKQKVVARRAAMAGFLILFSALVFGKWLLQIFGISLPSIRVGGGLLFIVMGLQLIISDHHDKIRTLQHPIARQRIKKLENHVNRIMNIMLDSYKDIHSNVALQEYFKNHTGKLNS